MWVTPGPSSRCPDACHSPDPPSLARMLLPLLLLLWAWGALAASPHLPPASLTLRVLKTTVFHNASSTEVAGMALLGDLETHSLACSTCEIRFLQPWAQQGLTPKQWQDLELLIHRSLADFIRLVNKVVQDEGGGYPFVTQISFSCELHPNGTSRRLCDVAVHGEDFISLDMDTGKWVTPYGEKLGSYIQDLVNQDRSISTLFSFLRRTTCLYGINIVAQYGRESLERQERPVAVVFARAPPPAGTPALVLLVCRVTGFYPRPVHVAWLQDGKEVTPGWWLNSSGILPNADLTYQLRSSLAVGPGTGHSYACRVQHSSLGGQSLLIPWEQSRPWGPGWAVGITLGVLAVAAMAVVLWRSRRRGYQDVRPGESSASGDGTGPGVGTSPSPGDMDLGNRSAPGSRAEGPED
ncbi:antigen-presenting glycoprotein CD1d-like [Chelonoidis abingdonii]|uniref:antigen-presenting glycoprotein CD1d-like n=1 Tax=Chelonoidis abingdonii TaxID=106734 RepID=UPI0013F1EBFB|nr:antigen-presenting glycoprotein CD1d-like isoform X2 [Chelonoidis abingdonii]